MGDYERGCATAEDSRDARLRKLFEILKILPATRRDGAAVLFIARAKK